MKMQLVPYAGVSELMAHIWVLLSTAQACLDQYSALATPHNKVFGAIISSKGMLLVHLYVEIKVYKELENFHLSGRLFSKQLK